MGYVSFREGTYGSLIKLKKVGWFFQKSRGFLSVGKQAINTNDAKQLRKAISVAPRGKRHFALGYRVKTGVHLVEIRSMQKTSRTLRFLKLNGVHGMVASKYV